MSFQVPLYDALVGIDVRSTMEDLKGKVALVTGASRGIGAGIARAFVDAGARVAITDVLDDEGKALAANLGPRAMYCHLDVADETQWKTVVSQVVDAWGGLDVLVNNAAILKFSRLADTSLDDYLAVVRVNQVGTFLGMRAVVEPMTRRGGGSIVNISSVDGMKGSNNLTSYAASKWAVRGMTKVAAQELGAQGIRVNSIHPGSILSAMTPSPAENPIVADIVANLAIPRVGLPADVADAVLFLASAQSRYITGCELPVDGGFINCRRIPFDA
jgi:3alpha(or 20beta)-hydroxysteroid dehydrogenase